MESKEFAYFLDACRRGNTTEVAQLCQLFPDLINIADAKGFTPLIIAVYNNQAATTELLLQYSADPNAQDLSGNTALMGACFKGYQNITSLLLQAGADVNIRNGQGATALIFAATFGQLEIAKLLLENGANTTFQDARGKTPLDHAVLQENIAMITLLQQWVTQPL